MFVKLTRSGRRTYAQLVESFRDDAGKPRQRTLATLGRINEDDRRIDALIDALLRAKGRNPGAYARPQIRFESALALGDVWTLDALWQELGFDKLAGVFRRVRDTTPVESAIRAMVFNRLCDPDSRLGVLPWLQTVRMSAVQRAELTQQQLLRSMDALIDNQKEVDDCVASLLRPLIDDELSVVFYDLTAIRAEALSEEDEDLRQFGIGMSREAVVARQFGMCKDGVIARQFGMSRDGVIARQCMLGVLQTAEGIPIHHEVFAGNTAEAATLIPALTTVLERFPTIKRLIVVADWELLSIDNLAQMEALVIPGKGPGRQSGKGPGREPGKGARRGPIEFILAVPARRYSDLEEILAPMHERARAAKEELIEAFAWQGWRLVVAHDPVHAAAQTALRRECIARLEQRAAELSAKLDRQDSGPVEPGRRLSESGAKARFFHEVCEASLASIMQVDLHADLFSYTISQQALEQAEGMDGKLVFVTNVQDLSPHDIVGRYKALADIEHGFRVPTSELEPAPIAHRLPDRIRAHASLCFMALVLSRVMRARLKRAGIYLTPEAALASLRLIQHHTVAINDNAPVSGISTVTHDQAQIFSALKVNEPGESPQRGLL